MTIQTRSLSGLTQRVIDRTPAGRWGVPQDFEGRTTFLASLASDFLTGTAIPLDGGFSSTVFLVDATENYLRYARTWLVISPIPSIPV